MIPTNFILRELTQILREIQTPRKNQPEAFADYRWIPAVFHAFLTMGSM
jgi:hypothetical protein